MLPILTFTDNLSLHQTFRPAAFSQPGRQISALKSRPDPDAAVSLCSGRAYGWNRECRVIEIACRASYGIELNEGCRGRGRQAWVAVDPIALRWKIKSRGRGDYLMSHDMEDIVAVLDGRPEVVGEIGRARITLRQHLLESFRELLESHRFREALSDPLAPDRASQSRVPTILSRIKQVTEL